MSLLSMAQSVCDEIGLPRPTSIAANTDQLARQLFALANKELGELSRAPGWPMLEQAYSFNTVGGQELYPLPADFSSFVQDTAYTTSGYYSIRGSVTPQEWRQRKQQLLSPLKRYAFRIMSGVMILDPVPDEVVPITYEYISSGYAVADDNTRSPRYTQDTDVSVVPEFLVQMGLMWRIKHAKGLEFSADRDEYDLAVKRTYAKALAHPSMDIGFSSLGCAPLTDGYVPDTGYGA